MQWLSTYHIETSWDWDWDQWTSEKMQDSKHFGKLKRALH